MNAEILARLAEAVRPDYSKGVPGKEARQFVAIGVRRVKSL